MKAQSFVRLMPSGTVTRFSEYVGAREKRRKGENSRQRASFIIGQSALFSTLMLASIRYNPTVRPKWRFDSTGFVLLLVFFIVTSLAFSWILSQKEKEGVDLSASFFSNPFDWVFNWIGRMPTQWRGVFGGGREAESIEIDSKKLAREVAKLHFPIGVETLENALTQPGSVGFCETHEILRASELAGGSKMLSPGAGWVGFVERDKGIVGIASNRTPNLRWEEERRLHLPIHDFALDPKGDRWAAVDEGGRLNLGRNDTESGLPLKTDKPLTRIRFDPNGRLWGMSADGTIWREESPGKGAFLRSAVIYSSFAPLGTDGFLGVDEMGRIRYENLDLDFQRIHCYQKPDMLAADPWSGQWMAVDGIGHFTLYNGLERRLERPLGRSIEACQISRWGRRLYFLAAGEGIILFDTPDRSMYEIAFTDPLKSFGADPWGRYLLLLTESQHLVLVGADGSLLEDQKVEGGEWIRVDHDGDRVWIVGKDGRLVSYSLFGQGTQPTEAQREGRGAFVELGGAEEATANAPDAGDALEPAYSARWGSLPFELESTAVLRTFVAPSAEYTLITDSVDETVLLDDSGRLTKHTLFPGGIRPPEAIGSHGCWMEDDLHTYFYTRRGRIAQRWDGCTHLMRYGPGPIAGAMILDPDRIVLVDPEGKILLDRAVGAAIEDLAVNESGDSVCLMTLDGRLRALSLKGEAIWDAQMPPTRGPEIFAPPSHSLIKIRPRSLRARKGGWVAHNRTTVRFFDDRGGVQFECQPEEGILDLWPCGGEILFPAGFEKVRRLSYNGEDRGELECPGQFIGAIPDADSAEEAPLALARFGATIFAVRMDGSTAWSVGLEEEIDSADLSITGDAIALSGQRGLAVFRLPWPGKRLGADAPSDGAFLEI